MKQFDFETLVRVSKILTTPPEHSRPITVEEVPLIGIAHGYYFASQRKVVVGDMYKFIYAYDSACGDHTLMRSTDTCISFAKTKVALAIDDLILAKEVYYNMKRREHEENRHTCR